MDDDDEKDQLPVHIILGVNDFTKIRTREQLRIGHRGDPVAKFPRFGWAIMSPGADQDISPGYLAVSSTTDYDNLCALDVLGLANTTGDQGYVFGEFKYQLTRSQEGWYETALPWKGNHPPLPSNHDGSVRHLNSLLCKLQRSERLAEYDAVIREQLKGVVVEKAPDEVKGKEFYLPHRVVMRENAESTKLRVVYDASACAHPHSTSVCIQDLLYRTSYGVSSRAIVFTLWQLLVTYRRHSCRCECAKLSETPCDFTGSWICSQRR